MADKISEALIDDILESTKKYSSKAEVPTVSAEEVDALLLSLGITDISEETKPNLNEKKETEKKELKKEPLIVQPKDIPIEETPQNSETVAEANRKAESEPFETVQREKTQAETLQGKEKSEEPEEEPLIPLSKLSERQMKKSSGFLDFIKKANAVFADESEDTENVSVSESEDGQMELQVDGEEISSPDKFVNEDEDETEKVKNEVSSFSGQISIEKTRMFNEVKIHGEYNPNISHNLGNKVIRTTKGEGEAVSTPVMGEEKYRKHFMNKPIQNLEKTQEHRALLSGRPEKTRETPGIIVKKNKNASADTDGFEPIPKIVPAESELSNEIYSHSDEISDGQIKLPGFGEIEEIEKTTEEEAEAKLLETRKEVVKDFVDNVIFKQESDEDDEDEENRAETPRRKHYDRKTNHVKREFFGPKDADAVEDEYYNEKKKLTAKTVVLSAICVVMAIISAVAGFGRGDFGAFGGDSNIYVAFELLLLAVCCVINFNSFKETIKSKFKPSLDLAVVISAFAGLLQIILAFVFKDSVETSVHLFSAAAVIPMIFKAVGELILCRNDIENFYIVSDEEHECYTVENIEDEESAAEIARGLMLGEPEIKYSSKTLFPARFVELSREADITPSILKISLLGVTAISLIIGIITLVIQKDVFVGITAFTGALLMGIPSSAGIIAAASLANANKKLRDDNTVINGYSAVENAVNSNGIIIDSADAFKNGGCNIEGIKLYHKMRIDEAILYTASVVIESGGVLSEIFGGVIEGKRELLLPVETLAYEEKLGCSCWIHNHRVLVGNKELLKHHNVEVPDDGLEEKFRSAGKNTLYLAIEGKIAAMFIVVYKADEMTAHYIRMLEKDGVSILFRTSDANITESFLEDEFGLPKNVVKIINPVAGEMFTKIKNEEKEKSDALLIHDGRTLTMLKALHSAFGITQFVNASKTVQITASVIGVILVAVLSFMSAVSQISVWQIILYQVIWGIVLYLLPAIKKPNKRAK